MNVVLMDLSHSLPLLVCVKEDRTGKLWELTQQDRSTY